MNSPLRVLHLEDDVRDTELVQAALEAEGIPIDLTRVETEQGFVSALNRGSSDLILADYTLPSFDGLSALRIAQQQLPNVPFLFVSGTLGEDVAIEALKTGATDYVLKTRLNRLGPAVSRALREASEKTERKRAEALLAAEKRILEMVAKGDSLAQILDTLCRLAEQHAKEVLASILLAENNRLRHGAAPSLPRDYIAAIDGAPIGPCAGSCGTAAFRGEQVIVEDIATDPLWADYRHAALSHSLRACWSTPVFSSEGKVIATFAIYYRELRSPTAQDLEVIELATRLARVAIERDHAQAAVRASEQVARGQVEALMQSLDVLATAPEPDKFIGQMLLSIGRQLQAARVLLWLRSHEDEKLRLRLAMEGENQVPEDPEHPFAKDPYAWKTVGFWQEMLFTGGPIVCEEIEEDARLSEEMRAYLTRKGTRKFLIVPVLVTGEVRGFIGIHHPARDPYRAEEIELAQALAHQVMLAIQLTQLAEQGRHAAILEERTRLARDIHDTLAQGFTGVVVQMEAAEDALGDQDAEEAVRHIHRARQLARESLGEARRSVHALRPKALENAGFWDALRGIIRNTTLGTPLQTAFRLEGDARELAPHVEENLLHIGQEALTNVLKHAQATRFETRLAFEPNAVCLELCDNGNGFVANGANGGFGLIGMRERVEQIGGTLTVTSARGEGTKIVAIAPYQEKGTT